MDTEEGNENEKKIISKTDWRKAHCSTAFSQHPLELIEDIDMRGRERTVRHSIPLLYPHNSFSLHRLQFSMKWRGKWLSFRASEAVYLQMIENAVWVAINPTFRAESLKHLVGNCQCSLSKQNLSAKTSALHYTHYTKQSNLSQFLVLFYRKIFGTY